MKSLLANRPTFKKAILYSLPALILGLTLRILLTYHYPYAYWTKDSFSFIDFSQALFLDGRLGFDEKRRYVYPLFLGIYWLIPFPILIVVPLIQHLIGLFNVITLGWICLRTLHCGKILIVPLTTLLAIHGNLIALEHAIMAESVSTALLLSALAGWIKWRTDLHQKKAHPGSNQSPVLTAKTAWLHIIPFVLLLLIKPSMRFLLPGWAISLALTKVWRSLRPLHYITIAAAIFLCLFTMGKETQGWRLLLTTAFPGLRVEGSKHPELIAEVQPLIDAARSNITAYCITDKEIKQLTEKPALFPQYPAWAALDGKKNLAKRHAIYRTLILESLRNDPFLIPTVSFWRLLTSSGQDFIIKFTRNEFLEELDTDSREILLSRYKKNDRLFQRLYGFPPERLIHSAEQYLQKIARGSDTFLQRLLTLLKLTSRSTRLTIQEFDREHNAFTVHFLPQFYLLIAGLIVVFVNKNYRTCLAAITLSVLGHLFFTYAIGSANTRFYCIFIPLQLLLMALPFDNLLSILLKKHHKHLVAQRRQSFRK